MTDQRLNELRDGLGEKTDAAIDAVLSGKDDTVDFAWIEQASRLIAAANHAKVQKSRLKRQALPLLLTLVCIVTPVALLMMPVNDVFLTIRLETSSMKIMLKKSWELPSSTVEYASIEGLTRIGSPELGIEKMSPTGDLQITAGGENITLQSLVISPALDDVSQIASTLTIRATGEGLKLITSDNTLEGRLAFYADSLIRIGMTGEEHRDIQPERGGLWAALEFSASGGNAAVDIRSKDWSLYGLRPAYIGFDVLDGDRELPEGQIFGSAVKGGTIRIHDKPSREIEIEEGDRVEIVGIKRTEVLKIEHDNLVSLLFRGKVESIRIGALNYERNIAPNMLEFIYFNWPIPAFMGIFAALSVLLLSIPKLISG